MRTFDARAAAIAVIGLTSACDFNGPTPTGLEDAFIEPDAAVIADAYSPDASAAGCQSISIECAGPKLRQCTAIGQQPTDTLCGWGCSAAPTPHCAKLQPAGGVLVETDLDDPGTIQDISFNANAVTFHTDTGQIDNVRNSGTGVKNGIEFTVRNGVGIFRMKSLTIHKGLIQNVVTATGTNALAIVSIGPVVFDRVVLDVSGDCQGSRTNAGPGGGKGGAADQSGSGQGAGSKGGGGMNASQGGAGAAYGGDGGDGGDGGGGGPNGANNWGVTSIPMIVGGSGGGGGGGTGAGPGGGGGGALQIITNGFVHMTGDNIFFAGAMASGCGGGGGTSKYGGGGGGSGGTILIEAPTFVLDRGGIAVNGGGGGAGGNQQNSGQGGDTGGFTTNRAGGGQANGAGGGGSGGARGDNSHDGNPGGNDSKDGGGGGGAVGMIRFNTYSGLIMVNNGFLSPSLSDKNQIATTQATANVR